jgi:predicted ATPase/class 3 adenylate cyclase
VRALPSGTVTLLFTDIEGSTRLLQDLGAAYPGLLETHGRILREAIAAGAGVEVSTEGDSFLAVFATPEGALRAAVQAQQSLAAADWPEGRQVRVRMGIHTGAVELIGRNYVGLDVHRAARIGAAGHGGQVLVSDATRALIEPELPPDVGLRDLGRHRLKDLEHPERLYQLNIHGLPHDFPPLRTVGVRRTNLTAQRTSFVGRDREVAEIIGLLGNHRLVTLTGPGGTGKTRVAIQVAGGLLDRFCDGVYLVDLSALSDASLVASSIAATIGVREEPGHDVLATLTDHLRDRRLLLVLDNFEQVVMAAVSIGRLLDDAPQLAVLTTSRVPLHASGEQEYPIPPLALPDPRGDGGLPALAANEAISLFVERASAVQPDFALTATNAGAVAELTRRLDGLPLAIELAASRVKLLTPQALVEHLEHRLPVLTGGPRDLPMRQRTLRAAIDWSWQLLDTDEQRLFARLGVFSGGWTLASAEAICQPSLQPAVIDALASLLDQSLVREDPPLDIEPRFRMLEVIGEYAAERLAASGEEDELRARHAEHFASLAEEGQSHLMGRDRIGWLARLDVELDNLRAGLEWSEIHRSTSTGLRIATAMWRYWQQRGRLDEGRRWLDRFVQPGEDARPDAALVRALGALGGMAYWQHDLPAMRSAYEQALQIARQLDNPALLGRALFDASFIPSSEDDPESAMAMIREALVNAERSGDRGLEGEIAGATAFAKLQMEGTESAIEPLSAAIAIQRELGHHAIVASQLIRLGGLERSVGRTEMAERHLGEALAMAREARDPQHLAGALTHLALVANERGRYERAARLIGGADRRKDEGASAPPAEIARRMGDPEVEARKALGDQAFEAVRAEGYAMTLEEAVAYALEEPAT